MKFIKIKYNRDQKTLFSCMIDGFMYFGGVPEEILFDNMKSVINHSNTIFFNVDFNVTFENFAEDCGFKPISCKQYRPQIKDNDTTLSKLNDYLKIYNYEFENYTEVENLVKSFMEDLNNEASKITGKIPLELFSEDRECFIPLRSLDILSSYISHEKQYRVTNKSMINYKGKKYPVPEKYIGLKLNVTEPIADMINIYYNKNFIRSHSLNHNKYNYKSSPMYKLFKSDDCEHISEDKMTTLMNEALDSLNKLFGK